jgi:hypothetical protein
MKFNLSRTEFPTLREYWLAKQRALIESPGVAPARLDREIEKLLKQVTCAICGTRNPETYNYIYPDKCICWECGRKKAAKGASDE